MNMHLDILGVQVVEQAKDMKHGKSQEYTKGFNDACELICDYLRETYKTVDDKPTQNEIPDNKEGKR